MPAGVQTERAGGARQLHSTFFRRAAALAVVARMAAGYQVFPGSLSGARARNHVIERQLARGHGAMAILAGITVAHQNVLARKGPRLMRNAAVFEQPNHGWHANGMP